MSKFYACCFLLFVLPSFAIAQLPNTNLYLFKMTQLTDSLFHFKQAKFLTGFNLKGYNNQPQFFTNNELYFTAQAPEDSTQTEIYLLNLADYTKSRVTQSVDSEYSPTLLPDGGHFSCIRVEKDGEDTQRLWQFPINRSNNGRPVLKNVENVGYHFWVNDSMLVLFIVGEPHRLVMANINTQKVTNITANIGRCFQRLPNGNIAFLQKISDTNWQIKALDLDTYRSSLIVPSLEGSEDFVCLPEGTFLMAKGSKLYKYNKVIDKTWLEIADFAAYGIRSITRMAVSGDNKLVMVVN